MIKESFLLEENKDVGFNFLNIERGSIIELGNKCDWENIKFNEWLFGNIKDFSQMRDTTEELIVEIFKRLKLDRNNYIAVCGDLGTGKSSYAIFLAYMIDPNFCYEKIIDDVDQFSNCLKEFRKDFTVVWDEADQSLSAQDWQVIKARRELKDVFVSQRAYRINVIFTQKTLALLYNVVRYLIDYAIFLKYRCPYHSHGFIYKTDIMVDSIEAFFKGTTTLPKEVFEEEKGLKEIIDRYFAKGGLKQKHMEEAQFSLINLIDFDSKKQELLLNDFLKFAKKKKIDPIKRGSKGIFKNWILENINLPLSDRQIDELYNKLKFMCLK